jgi:hypothetical protein
MVQEVMKSQCGILFDESALKRAAIYGVAAPGIPLEETPAHQATEQGDALQPIHDELKQNVLWWLLEIIPLFYSWQDVDGVWHKEYG